MSIVVLIKVLLIVLLVIIIKSVLEVPGRLINFSTRGIQELLSSSFNPIKFILEVFSDIPNVFQWDVPLLGVLFL